MPENRIEKHPNTRHRGSQPKRIIAFVELKEWSKSKAVQQTALHSCSVPPVGDATHCPPVHMYSEGWQIAAQCCSVPPLNFGLGWGP
eukprot:m.186532 g.186532  ORF g.186532 m.186532 type:complete len:87 (-) comp24765_c2_seq2:778-1038(-)